MALKFKSPLKQGTTGAQPHQCQNCSRSALIYDAQLDAWFCSDECKAKLLRKISNAVKGGRNAK